MSNWDSDLHPRDDKGHFTLRGWWFLHVKLPLHKLFLWLKGDK